MNSVEHYSYHYNAYEISDQSVRNVKNIGIQKDVHNLADIIKL